MAISLDTSTTSASITTASSFSLTHTCTGASLLVVEFAQDTTNTDLVTAITYNGVSMTRVGSAGIGLATRDWMGVWYLFNPAAGANSISVTTSGSVFGGITAASYKGTSTSALDSNNSQSATNAGTNALTISTTTVADNCWAITCTYSTNNGTSYGGSFSSRQNWASSFAGTGGIADTNAVVHPAGSVSGSITNTNSTTGAITLSIAPAGAAPVVSPFRALLGVGI